MILVILISAVLAVAAVGIHYEALVLLSIMLRQPGMRHRHWIVVGLIGALLAHVVEIHLFALGYMILSFGESFGSLVGEITHSFADYSYYSFVVYTSVGFGDITPVGPLRFLSSIETLTGLILIAWTASFLYIEMSRSWNSEHSHVGPSGR